MSEKNLVPEVDNGQESGGADQLAAPANYVRRAIGPSIERKPLLNLIGQFACTARKVQLEMLQKIAPITSEEDRAVINRVQRFHAVRYGVPLSVWLYRTRWIRPLLELLVLLGSPILIAFLVLNQISFWGWVVLYGVALLLAFGSTMLAPLVERLFQTPTRANVKAALFGLLVVAGVYALIKAAGSSLSGTYWNIALDSGIFGVLFCPLDVTVVTLLAMVTLVPFYRKQVRVYGALPPAQSAAAFVMLPALVAMIEARRTWRIPQTRRTLVRKLERLSRRAEPTVTRSARLCSSGHVSSVWAAERGALVAATIRNHIRSLMLVFTQADYDRVLAEVARQTVQLASSNWTLIEGKNEPARFTRLAILARRVVPAVTLMVAAVLLPLVPKSVLSADSVRQSQVGLVIAGILTLIAADPSTRDAIGKAFSAGPRS